MYKFLSCLLLGFCLHAHANLTNFGDPNTQKLNQAFSQKAVHIVQLGDSHTAGDTMTDALRDKLQSVMGDGGMGWAMPMYFHGQRMARFGYDNSEFRPISSRHQTGNFTLGGMIAKPQTNGATLTLKAKNPESPQRLIVSIRQSPTDGRFIATDATGKRFAVEAPKKNNTWQLLSIDASLPLYLYAENTNESAIGGWWAFNPNARGAVVSAIGINGAELSYWNRWNTQAWQSELATIHPTLIILAYGTNEAYNGVVGDTVKTELTKRIRQIRQASPSSAILIMSAPESLKNTSGGCGTRPRTLDDIQYTQKQVAQNEHTLFWDWQGAMGGACTMKSWITRGLANKDGVHFSKSGYTHLGERFAEDLLSLYATPNRTLSHHQSQPNQGRGYIRIERVN